MIRNLLIGITTLAVLAGLAMLGMMFSAGMFASDAIYSTDNGAIDGHDPVAYFSNGAPVAGSSEHSHEWNGATWFFASAANRDLFIADPERYAPQYGGYCAFGMASGYTAYTDPAAFTIVNNKLYLNYDKDVQSEWLADRDAMIVSADANWASTSAELGH